jgi:hypothetical protein
VDKRIPLEILGNYLRIHHPEYTVDDVVLSKSKGYLLCIKSCPHAGKWYLCNSQEHYHTISIYGEGYPRRRLDGQFESPYRLWRELHGLLPFGEWPDDDPFKKPEILEYPTPCTSMHG